MVVTRVTTSISDSSSNSPERRACDIPFAQRQACQPCHEAKVKCQTYGHLQPPCIRCSRKKLDCHFPKRHRGKQLAAKPQDPVVCTLPSNSLKSLAPPSNPRIITSLPLPPPIKSPSAVSIFLPEPLNYPSSVSSADSVASSLFIRSSPRALPLDDPWGAKLHPLPPVSSTSLPNDVSSTSCPTYRPASALDFTSWPKQVPSEGAQSDLGDYDRMKRRDHHALRSADTVREASWGHQLASPQLEKSFPSLLTGISANSLMPHLDTHFLISEKDIQELVNFYFERLNPAVALLTLSQQRRGSLLFDHAGSYFLTLSICTTASAFILPQRYLELTELVRIHISHLSTSNVAVSFEDVQGLYLLTQFKAPEWFIPARIIRLAFSLAWELGLHHSFSPSSKHSPATDADLLIERQRLFFLLSKTDTAFSMRHKLPRSFEATRADIPSPEDWLASLGNDASDLDHRAAVGCCLQESGWHLLQGALNVQKVKPFRERSENDTHPDSSTLEQDALKTDQAKIKIMKDGLKHLDELHEKFSRTSHHPVTQSAFLHQRLALYQGLFKVYCKPSFNHAEEDRREAFTKASTVALSQLRHFIDHTNVLRFADDQIILGIASATLWMCDNYVTMPSYDSSLSPTVFLQAVSDVKSAVDRCLPTPFEHFHDLSQFLTKVTCALPAPSQAPSFCAQGPHDPIPYPIEGLHRIDTLHGFLGCPSKNGTRGFASDSLPPSSHIIYPTLDIPAVRAEHPPFATVDQLLSTLTN